MEVAVGFLGVDRVRFSSLDLVRFPSSSNGRYDMASLDVGGSLLLVHGVTWLGMEIHGSWFVELGFSSSLAWCVLVDLFTTAVGCEFEYAVGLVLELRGWLA